MNVRSWRGFDFWLIGAVAILTIFGIAMIRSAIAGNTVLSITVSRQIIFAAIGFVVLMITVALDYHLWASFGKVLYVLVVILLAVISISGTTSFGSQRWLSTGLVNIQPSELAKIVTIILLSDYFARNKDRAHNLGWVVRSFLLTMSLVVWVLLQPDLSTSIVLLVIWFALLWASGLSTKYIWTFAGIGGLAGLVGIPLMLLNYNPANPNNIIKPYQIQRVVNFLFPDPNSSYGAIYNVQQALIAIGNGGWAGQGYGQGPQVQLRFLKVRHTDFIFSALSEEFGFIGAALVLMLIAFIIIRCLRIARTAPDTFGGLMAYGVATLIFFHTLVNVGMNLRLLPVTGLPLPFVSYGGSTLLSFLLGIGIVESVAVRQKTLEF